MSLSEQQLQERERGVREDDETWQYSLEGPKKTLASSNTITNFLRGGGGKHFLSGYPRST